MRPSYFQYNSGVQKPEFPFENTQTHFCECRWINLTFISFSAENASPAKDNANKPSPRARGRPKGTAMVSNVNRNKSRTTAKSLGKHNCFLVLTFVNFSSQASDDEFAGLSDDEKPRRKAVKSRQPARAKGRRSYQEISDEDYDDDFSEEEVHKNQQHIYCIYPLRHSLLNNTSFCTRYVSTETDICKHVLLICT